MNDPASGPASIAALRDAVLKGREPPPARMVASLASYRWLVVGTVCIGAFMGQVDSSITQLLLPRLELEFNARSKLPPSQSEQPAAGPGGGRAPPPRSDHGTGLTSFGHARFVPIPVPPERFSPSTARSP
jgi:hypothetical protein